MDLQKLVQQANDPGGGGDVDIETPTNQNSQNTPSEITASLLKANRPVPTVEQLRQICRFCGKWT